jgi:hypothetical protein
LIQIGPVVSEKIFEKVYEGEWQVILKWYCDTYCMMVEVVELLLEM